MDINIRILINFVDVIHIYIFMYYILRNLCLLPVNLYKHKDNSLFKPETLFTDIVGF